MHRLLIALSVVIAMLVLWLWGFGGADALARWAAEGQRTVQEAMADMLRRLRAGEPSALLGLWTLCFAYGFFHAMGPGHGKLLIGGYGVGRRVALLKLSGLAVTSSLAQAATAVVLVYAGVFLLDLTRSQITDMGDAVLAPLSAAMIAVLGLWLIWRGTRRLVALRRKAERHGHDHARAGENCAVCGHRHAPDLDEAAGLHDWRAALAVIGAIAIRPCTGALFLLILTWRMGLAWAGIAGAFIMGAGTATISVMVALAAVTFREGLLDRMRRNPLGLRAVPLIEITVGMVIVMVTGNLLLAR